MMSENGKVVLAGKQRRKPVKRHPPSSELQLLHRLDNAAGPQAVRAQGQEIRPVLEGGDAAGGLDFQVRGDVLFQQGHVRRVAPPPAKPVEVLI